MLLVAENVVMWLPCMSKHLSASRLIEVHTLSKVTGFTLSPNQHSLLVAVIPPSHLSAQYIPKSLRVFPAKNPGDRGQRIALVN
jgi:hypothetical protein